MPKTVNVVVVLVESQFWPVAAHTHTDWPPLDQPQFQYMLISLDFNKNSDLNKLKAPEQTKLECDKCAQDQGVMGRRQLHIYYLNI